jgi:hypothetical protein
MQEAYDRGYRLGNRLGRYNHMNRGEKRELRHDLNTFFNDLANQMDEGVEELSKED